jgi:tetratricopeptide (TPR) repeat protein
MRWSDFHKLIGNEAFFNHLDVERDPDCWRWLQLVRTEAIKQWAYQSSWFAAAIRHGDPRFVPILKLLLRRHVLHLAHRRDVTALGEFWRWAVPYPTTLAELWERAGLPQTLDQPTIADQEKDFAQRLVACSKRVENATGPKWASETLGQLARERDLLGQKASKNTSARVVFCWEGKLPPAMRSGLLVDFRLLAANTPGQPVCSGHIFDRNFLEALKNVEQRLAWKQFRKLDHDWGFLDEPVLGGTSGTTVIYLTQWLALRGRFAEAQCWTIPPWVVISGSLDGIGDAGPTDRLREKAEVLVEEGVRVMIIAASSRVDYQAVAGIRHGLSGAEDLAIRSIPGGHKEFANELYSRSLLWPANIEPFQDPTLLGTRSDEDFQIVIDQQKDPFLHDIEKEYVVPEYAFRALQEKLREMPRGYVHLKAPPGMGKSILVKALRKGWKGGPGELGRVIGYTILHGHSEDPFFFLEEVIEQAKKLDPNRPLFNLPLPHQQKTLPDVRQALRTILGLVKKSCCPDRPLILALDGLDELTQRDHQNSRVLIVDTLPAAHELPAGCFVLVTSRPYSLRPQVELKLRNLCTDATLFRTVELNPDNPGYRQVLRTYLEQTLGQSVIPHVDAILAKGKYSFLHVRFLRALLRDRKLEQLPSLELPEADAIFAEYLREFEQLVDREGTRFRDWHLPVLLLIAAACEPVTRAQLLLWLDRPDCDAGHQLNMALQHLAPLLDKQPVLDPRSEDAVNDDLFSLGHQELREYLEKTGGVRNYGHRQIAKASEAHMASGDYYHPLYALSHWLDAGDTESAAQCLANDQRKGAVDELVKAYSRGWKQSRVIQICTIRINQLERLQGLGVSDSRWRCELAMTYNDRSLAFADIDRIVDANEDSRRAEELLTAFGSEAEGNEFLADVLRSRGGILINERRLVEEGLTKLTAAIKHYQTRVDALGGKEAALHKNHALLQKLADAHLLRADVLAGLGKSDGAIQDSIKGISLMEQVKGVVEGEAASSDPGSVAASLAMGYLCKAQARVRQQRFDLALEEVEKARQLSEQLIEQLGGQPTAIRRNPSAVHVLACAQYIRGEALSGQHYPRKARGETLGGHYTRKIRDKVPDHQYYTRKAREAFRSAINLLTELINGQGGETVMVRERPALIFERAMAHLSCLEVQLALCMEHCRPLLPASFKKDLNSEVGKLVDVLRWVQVAYDTLGKNTIHTYVDEAVDQFDRDLKWSGLRNVLRPDVKSAWLRAVQVARDRLGKTGGIGTVSASRDLTAAQQETPAVTRRLGA